MRPIKLVQIRADTYASDTVAASGELDLGPYVNAGKRQIQGAWYCIPTQAATDTDATYDNKFQESATTVDSDFSDISGATFTQVVGTATPALQTIVFTTSKRYIRAYPTLGGTAASAYDLTMAVVTARFDT